MADHRKSSHNTSHNTQQLDNKATTARRSRARRIKAGHTAKLKVIAAQLSQARQSAAVGGAGGTGARARVKALEARRTILQRELKAANQFA